MWPNPKKNSTAFPNFGCHTQLGSSNCEKTGYTEKLKMFCCLTTHRGFCSELCAQRYLCIVLLMFMFQVHHRYKCSSAQHEGTEEGAELRLQPIFNLGTKLS